MSRFLEIIGLFCRILSLFQGSFAKETYHFKEPTNFSHPPIHTFPLIHTFSHTLSEGKCVIRVSKGVSYQRERVYQSL